MKRLKIYTTLIAILVSVSLPLRIVQACGFYVTPGEYRFWLLQPDLTNQPDLTPFFFASSYLYKGNENLAVETYPQQNIEEWYRQIKGKASRQDIDTLLNDTPPQSFFDKTEAVERNGFFKYLLKPKSKNLFQYINLSKKTEEIANSNNPWNENVFPEPYISKVIAEANTLYHQSHSSFLKLRIAYQLMRLRGYNGESSLSAKLYDSLISPLHTRSWIKTAALYEKAVHTDGLKGDYLLSKAFDAGNYHRTACLVSFRSNKLDSLLPFAKNNHERNVMYAMKVCNYPGRSLAYIQNIYHREPGYKELPFLLLREINKIEDWLVTNKVTDFASPAVYPSVDWPPYNYATNASANYRSDQLYAKRVYQFLLQTVHDGKNKDVALLRLFAAHLALLNKDYKASAYLLHAINESTLPANIKSQIKINQLLLQLEKGWNRKTETAFVNIINTTDEKLGIYDAAIMKDQLILYTAKKLMQQGNNVKGLMLLSRTRRALGELLIGDYKNVYQFLEENADANDYDSIIHILLKKDKNRFEKFTSIKKFSSASEYSDYYGDSTFAAYWDVNKLLDCKAGFYIRRHNLPSAMAVLKQIPDSFYKAEPYATYIDGDPFYVNVYNSHKKMPEEKINLGKKEVVDQMLRLQQLAVKDKSKAALCYYQLANAWYNLTYYGKDWLMVKQWWSAEEISSYDPGFKRNFFNDDYYGCNYARQYYLKAMRETNDESLKKLSAFMAGVCTENYDQYNWCLQHRDKDAWDYKKGKSFFARLQRSGVDKKYYDEIIEECELYQSYINQYHQQL